GADGAPGRGLRGRVALLRGGRGADAVAGRDARHADTVGDEHDPARGADRGDGGVAGAAGGRGGAHRVRRIVGVGDGGPRGGVVAAGKEEMAPRFSLHAVVSESAMLIRAEPRKEFVHASYT